MYGVMFGDYNSFDYNIFLKNKKIGTPSIKTSTVNVPGSDGVLDFSEFDGQVHYGNRPITFNFLILADWELIHIVHSDFANDVHGRKLKIVLDEDPDYYYLGRVEVGDLSYSKGAGSFAVSCDCDPWKYKSNITSKIFNLTAASIDVELMNLRRPVVPMISTTAPIKILWGSEFKNSVNIETGDNWRIPSLILEPGANTYRIESTASASDTVKFEYQEGGI